MRRSPRASCACVQPDWEAGGIALRCGVRARRASSAPLRAEASSAQLGALCALRAIRWPLPRAWLGGKTGRRALVAAEAVVRAWALAAVARGASVAGDALPGGDGGGARVAPVEEWLRVTREALVKLLADEPANDDAPPAMRLSRLAASARGADGGDDEWNERRFGVPGWRGRRRARGGDGLRFGVDTRDARALRAALTGSATAAWARRPRSRPPLTRRPSARGRRADPTARFPSTRLSPRPRRRARALRRRARRRGGTPRGPPRRARARRPRRARARQPCRHCTPAASSARGAPRCARALGRRARARASFGPRRPRARRRA